jgi:3-oxoacyl-[acyl-carrier-protein] synthase-3
VFLEAIAYEMAPQVVTSASLENRLAPLYRRLFLQPGQLEALTGIRERRWWNPGFTHAGESAKAAEKAIAESGVPVKDIGALIYCGVCRDHFEPATACGVAAELGLSDTTVIYDLSNACLGMASGVIEMANRIELGQVKAGLVASCETARDIVEEVIQQMIQNGTMDYFKAAFTTLTLGSGAAAMLLTDGSYSSHAHRLVGGSVMAAPQHHKLCRWGLTPKEADGSQHQFMETDAMGMLKHSWGLAGIGNLFREHLGWSKEQLDRIVCHQVAATNQEQILKALEVAPEKDFSTLAYLGNMGTVSLPITAALAHERGFLQKGHKVAFFGIGSGLNSMMLGWEW